MTEVSNGQVEISFEDHSSPEGKEETLEISNGIQNEKELENLLNKSIQNSISSIEVEIDDKQKDIEIIENESYSKRKISTHSSDDSHESAIPSESQHPNSPLQPQIFEPAFPKSEFQSSFPNKEQIEIIKDEMQLSIIRHRIRQKYLSQCAKRLKVKEGILYKKARKIGLGYQKRHCILENKSLKFYKNKGDKKLGGVLEFDYLTCALQVENKGAMSKKFLIHVLMAKRQFKFKAKTHEEMKEWVFLLSQHIQLSDGRNKDITRVAIQKNFWKFPRITDQEFREKVNTGDLLLFTGKSFSSKVTRTAIRSRFDHVGLLLRYEDRKIVILEVTGTDGVALYNWDDFLRNKWHLQYTRLIYRALTFERTPAMLGNLERYLQKVRGKKYKLNICGLCRKTAEDESSKKTYFCSELIASVYKEMGLLPVNTSSAGYMPGAFSTEKQLNLLNNAELGDEYFLDYNL